MNQKEITEALQQIANNKGCTPEEARRGIQLAIDAARENPDPNVRAVWESFPHEGEELTPEDIIAFFYGRLMKADFH